MTSFPQDVNTDNTATKTTAKYEDRGDGTSEWVQTSLVYNGGDVTQGSTTDAAVTDPATNGTVISFLRGILTFLRVSAVGLGKAEDAVAVSGDTGVAALAVRRDTPTSDVADGDYAALSVTSDGSLRTSAPTTELLELTNATVSAYVTNLVVKATAGRLYGIQGYNSGPPQFIQIHDAASLPADTAVPEVVFSIAATTSFSLDFGAHGRAFTTGIVVCNSSTAPTKTIASADCWIDAQYL